MVEFVACFRTLDQESRWVHSIEQGSRHTRTPVYRLWNGTDFGGSTGKKLPGSWKQLDLACERRYLCGAAPCSVQTAHENLPFRCPPPPRSASQCAYICSHLLPQFHQARNGHFCSPQHHVSGYLFGGALRFSVCTIKWTNGTGNGSYVRP